MKVILLKDIKGTGKKDQIIEVSDGFGRNYLLPRKLVVEANPQAMTEYKNREAAKKHHEEMERQKAKDTAAVAAYFAAKAEKEAAEKAAAAEKARLEREANPTTEDLLKKILTVLETK